MELASPVAAPASTTTGAPAIGFVPAARLPRGRIDRATARALDKLSRRAHRFHRFAHHPLCDRYAGEVVRIGRVRLCRGCTYAIVGGIAGIALAGTIVPIAATATGAAALAGTLVPIAATATGAAMLFATLWLRRRPSKIWTRLVPAALFALAFTGGMRSLEPLGIAAACAAACVVGGLRVLYGKRGADRRPCTTCPERTDSPCSGFKAIVSRERAFQRVAMRRLHSR